jgi:hypothetical protein
MLLDDPDDEAVFAQLGEGGFVFSHLPWWFCFRVYIYSVVCILHSGLTGLVAKFFLFFHRGVEEERCFRRQERRAFGRTPKRIGEESNHK